MERGRVSTLATFPERSPGRDPGPESGPPDPTFWPNKIEPGTTEKQIAQIGAKINSALIYNHPTRVSRTWWGPFPIPNPPKPALQRICVVAAPPLNSLWRRRWNRDGGEAPLPPSPLITSELRSLQSRSLAQDEERESAERYKLGARGTGVS